MCGQPIAGPGTSYLSERVVGGVLGDDPGPTLIVMSGIHGNEHAGVEAGRRVLERLSRRGGVRCGEFVVVAGNLRALAEDTRFIDRDLNREWLPENVKSLIEGGDPSGTVELEELLQVALTLSEIARRARAPIHFLDLHTSSASGPPFVTVGDTLRNRRFALGFPLPLILGLEEQVDGALLEFLNNLGLITMGVEAGQHRAASSVDRLEAVLWLALEATGLIADDDGGCSRARTMLLEASRGMPRVVEVRYRHAITPLDGFEMNPGYANFHAVRRGQLVARERNGPVAAPQDGLILLPLYQGKGDDGFFLAREVRPFWLRVSAALRVLRVATLVRFLPGVRRHPTRAEVLLVDTRIARWFTMEVFHLLGFRKLRRNATTLMVSRRKYDVSPPRRISLRPLERFG